MRRLPWGGPKGGAAGVAVANRRQVYGLHAVRALLARRPKAIVVAKLLDETSGRLAELVDDLRQQGVPIERVRRAELDRFCGGATHQGVLIEVEAAAEFTLGDFEALVLERGRALRLLILDGVEDPRNLGACLRTADAAGVDAVVVPKAHSAPLTAVALKAATGAAETVPVLRAPNLARTLRWLKQAGVWVVGADAQTERSLYATSLSSPVAIVLGGEGRGLRHLTRELCDELVAIPMVGAVASLNVSVAAGVVLFELLRQARSE
ncbi:MAG TPA: 23S rRNA (guanosine(2251)-2'-O)-methyltransferase RlmB [Gammaproteobacteria bacterium]|nr:23S rRNA (guanosine(2251)-2'-O)-methyltransferase RlmB [Gammaproteobacteria bacterium]